jgi:solute carrier family 25 aspartate/glutamate transporter 12/13
MRFCSEVCIPFDCPHSDEGTDASKALPLPGSDHGEASLEPSVGLAEANAPLPYLRSRNALKVILDLDENFGRPRMPAGHKWTGVPGFGGSPKA